jgi:hypothetical protein
VRTIGKLKGKHLFIGIVAIIGFFTAAARIVTAFYYLNANPRSAQPATERVYPVGAAYNTLVFVNKRELEWLNFLNYDMMTVLGLGVVLLAVFVIIPKARREGKL